MYIVINLKSAFSNSKKMSVISQEEKSFVSLSQCEITYLKENSTEITRFKLLNSKSSDFLTLFVQVIKIFENVMKDTSLSRTKFN